MKKNRSQITVLHTYYGRIRDTTRLINEAQSATKLGYTVIAIGTSREGFDSEPTHEQINGVDAWLVPIPATLNLIGMMRLLFALLLAKLPDVTTQVPSNANTIRTLIRVIFYNLWLCRMGGRFQAEIVHCHEIWATPGSWLLSRLMGAKFVYDIWEPDFFLEPTSFFTRVMFRWQGWAVRRADVVIITARRLIPKLEDAKQIVHIGNWKSKQDYDATTKAEHIQQIRADLNLDDYDYVISWIGFFFVNRNPEILLEVMVNTPDVAVIMAGRGDKVAEIQHKAEQYPNIIWLDWLTRDEVVNYTLASDVICTLLPDAPRFHYTMPNKFSEGVVAGKVVLATRGIGEFADTIQDNTAGYLVDDYTADNLSKAIEELKDAQLRQQLSDNSYALRDQYSWERAEQILDELYQSLT